VVGLCGQPDRLENIRIEKNGTRDNSDAVLQYITNYTSQKEEFARNILQNDGIRCDSPYLHR